MADLTKPDFSGPEWARLTIAERVAQCHAFAREALQLAQAAAQGTNTQQNYRDNAAQWNTLAAEMEEARGEFRT